MRASVSRLEVTVKRSEVEEQNALLFLSFSFFSHSLCAFNVKYIWLLRPFSSTESMDSEGIMCVLCWFVIPNEYCVVYFLVCQLMKQRTHQDKEIPRNRSQVSSSSCCQNVDWNLVSDCPGLKLGYYVWGSEMFMWISSVKDGLIWEASPKDQWKLC